MKTPALIKQAGGLSGPLKHLIWILLIAVLCGTFSAHESSAQTLPTGFVHERVTGGISAPTSMAFLPDGRALICQQNGNVRVVLTDGTLVSTAALTRSVNTDGERGMIGIAVDPDFASNSRVYIFYNPVVSGSVKGRVSRFTMSGNTISSASELVLVEYTDQHMFHNGGALAFGVDGKLYIGTGEDTQGSPAQNLDDFRGKVLRINTDGSVPTGNPFTGGSARSRVWAFGMRNPFTLTPDLAGSRMFVNDVGDSSWEEVNNCTTGGRNFGWPNQDGFCTSGCSGQTQPLYVYPVNRDTSPPDGEGVAITGGVVFRGEISNWPTTYHGKYFIIEFRTGWINFINPNVTSPSRNAFATGLGADKVYLKQGPHDGNLYYLRRGSDNALHRIRFAQNSPPAISSQPQSVTVAQGGTATFNVTASGSSPLTYRWRKNGTVISGGPNSPTFSINSVQSTDAGTYSVIVSNSFGTATSANATLTVAQPLPSPWLNQDIGAVTAAGSASFLNGTFTIDGDGADIWSTADAFHFVHQPISGDVDIRARVTGVEPTNPWAKAGVMIRETLAAGSANAFVAVSASNGVTFQRRTATGGTSTSTVTAGISAPHWVRLVRSGNTFTAFRSTDGVTWTTIGSTNITMGASIVVGLGVTSHSAGVLCTASFSNVQVILPNPPVATIDAPADGTLFRADDVINFRGHGTSSTGSPLPNSAFSWSVLFVHVDHDHGGPTIPSGVTNGSFTASAEGHIEADDIRYRITLTVTDGGQTATDVVDVLPRTSLMTIDTVPSGMNVRLAGSLKTTPQNLQVLSGQTETLEAVTPQVFNGIRYVFDHWEDGPTANPRNITATDSAATFRAVYVEAPPLPAPWLNSDVGTPGAVGNASFANNVFTVSGAGADIFGTSDSFHYLYQEVIGDVEIIARVLTQQNTDPWAKAGVMIRQSLAAGSQHALLAVSPANGVAFQRRLELGLSTSNTGAAGTVPIWLRLSRSGNTFTASTSSDGATWTQVGTDTINMTSDVLIGIPVCSHVTGTLNTSTFDNVTVTTSTAGPVVLYRETFGAPAGTDLASIPFDWQTFESNGVARTAVNVNRTATNPGDPTDAVNTTSAGPNQDGSFTAFATGWLYEQSAQRLAMTPEFSFNPADFSIIKFSWNQMNADATRGTRLAIRVGTQWYVHATVQNGGLGTATDWAANGQAKEVTFNPAAANWRILNFNGNYTMGATPGTGTGANSTLGNITVGAQPGANLSGTITAFGIFSDGVGTGNSRFDTFAITATSSSLPSPWASTDVGAVTAAGSASHSAGTFTLNGDGSDIFGTADAFLFVYQPASGDCDIRARVATIEPTNPWAKAGVMIRESLNANSAHAMTIISPSNGVSFQRRVSTGASSGSTTIAGIAAPHWVRMVRSGSTFTSSHSSDGVSWTTVGSTNITMGSSVFIGLPMTSHTPGVLGTSTIDNVTAVP